MATIPPWQGGVCRATGPRAAYVSPAGSLGSARPARDVRWGTRMHAIFFGLKRAYYATLGLTRWTLRKMGLTAARFDMLYALTRGNKSGMLQSQLRRELGVCPSVVSRMLKSMVQLGYVKRDYVSRDKRQRWVKLTTIGRTCILRAIRQFIGWGYVQLALYSVLEPELWHNEWRARAAVSRADGIMRKIRVGFGDTARLLYPFGIDKRMPRLWPSTPV
jgi:DNA-binding MarR family transcriptional regulator